MLTQGGNGVPLIMPFKEKLTDSQQDCVNKLAEALEQAKAGNINSIGLVCCMRKGYAHVIGGTSAAELNLGLDSLKRAILDGVENNG